MENGPAERTETLRISLAAALASGEWKTLRELSQELSASERDLVNHLEHLARSRTRSETRLLIEPARCLGCGFEFEDRTRVKKPGRCPACKSTRIALPRFKVASG